MDHLLTSNVDCPIILHWSDDQLVGIIKEDKVHLIDTFKLQGTGEDISFFVECLERNKSTMCLLGYHVKHLCHRSTNICGIQ